MINVPRDVLAEIDIVLDAMRAHVMVGGGGFADPLAFGAWVQAQGREAIEVVARCSAHWEYHQRETVSHA